MSRNAIERCKAKLATLPIVAATDAANRALGYTSESGKVIGTAANKGRLDIQLIEYRGRRVATVTTLRAGLTIGDAIATLNAIAAKAS